MLNGSLGAPWELETEPDEDVLGCIARSFGTSRGQVIIHFYLGAAGDPPHVLSAADLHNYNTDESCPFIAIIDRMDDERVRVSLYVYACLVWMCGCVRGAFVDI